MTGGTTMPYCDESNFGRANHLAETCVYSTHPSNGCRDFTALNCLFGRKIGNERDHSHGDMRFFPFGEANVDYTCLHCGHYQKES